MALSFLAPNRTVLLMADEALYIYATSSRGARLVEAVPWGTEAFEKNVSDIIIKDCGNKPILILNDMVEQHYRKERVVKAGVSMLDRSAMLKRKLNIAFPNYPIRAALPLKEKLPNVDKKKAADIFIFAAIPASDQYKKAISAANLSLCSVSAFCLLPIESADMVKELATKLGGKKKNGARWVVFIGQHQNGGLRQVVTKNGELALTRMTPIVDDDSDPELWASEVHQEFKATMSYLSRFGFQQEDGLDVILIANPGQGDLVEQLIQENCNFHTLTAPEAGRHLGMNVMPQDDMRYADILHVTWSARKPRFILPMSAKEIDQVSMPRKVSMAASVLLVLSGGFLAYQLTTGYGAISSISSDLEEQKSRFAQYDSQYQREVKRKEEMGFDVKLVQSSIAINEALAERDIHVLRLFYRIGEALGPELNIDRVLVTRNNVPLKFGNSNQNVNTYGKEPPKTPIYEGKLQMTYPSTANIDLGNREVQDLASRMQSLMPENRVIATKLLQDYDYVDEIVVETGSQDKRDVSQDFLAEITIEGPGI